MKKTLIILTTLLFSYGFTAFSQATVEFETITEALNYDGDRDAVKKLIITGTISGDDYSEDSEWYQFRYLYIPFSNLDTVEILTYQDIPDWGNGIYVDGGFFTGANWLKNFSAPNIKYIGSDAFTWCENLISVNAPLVETIRYNAFNCCHSLTSVNFPVATTIGYAAFYDCRSLISINLLATQTIGDNAFAHCYSLSTVNFPVTTTIGYNAFVVCTSLVSVNFPLIETITGGAFWSCENLISANFPLATTIGFGAFGSCHNLFVNFPAVIEIEGDAFYYCTNLTSVNFPLATTIGNRAFGLCTSLVSINFPVAETIEESAFVACYSLNSIDFPIATIIGNYAFSECKSLVSVSFGTGFERETNIYFRRDVFSNVPTENIDLTLGKYVWPQPNLNTRIWQAGKVGNPPETADPYVWKSIKIGTSNIEEIIRNSVVNIFPNPTSANFTISFELEKSCNMKIVLCDILGQELVEVCNGFTSEGLFIRTFNTEHLAKGVYFLKILFDGNIVVEKVVVN